jgi:hypothetical protein
MTKPPIPNPLPKLPQARLYLEIALWGFDQLLNGKLMSDPFRFHIVGILASLRAVQHHLKNSDATISNMHRSVIDQWWDDPAAKNAPELDFIQTSRNLMLKGGNFQSYVTRTTIGPDESGVTRETYTVEFHLDGIRYDQNDIKKALAWCERELTSIEARLP